MPLDEFQSLAGLRFGMAKGGMVTSKRISRFMRRYAAFGFFRAHKIRVLYLDQDEFEAKVWDGAGVISRRMLRRIISQVPTTLPERRRRTIIRELQTCNRVEFTLMGAGENGGQDKGHCIVSDTLTDYDFILPHDTKQEAMQVNRQAFVGINFVHGHDEMRLDVQSIINLYPFFDVPHMLDCLRQESELFTTAVASGQVDKAMNRIDTLDSVDDLGDWYIAEYLASGGQAMWFASVVRGLIGQHLNRLNHTQLHKLRMPINGGRYYVMPVGVGKAAGVERIVNPGEAYIDPAYGTL
jgi:hypothetical protein